MIANWAATRARVKAFVEERVYPAEGVLDHGAPAEAQAMLAGLMAEAKAAGLWALGHPVAIGGQGMPFLDYVHVNEVVGRSQHAMVALGTHSLQDALMLDRYAAPVAGEVSGTACGGRHLSELRDDRARRRVERPDAVADVGDAGGRGVGHPGAEVVHYGCGGGGIHDGDVPDRGGGGVAQRLFDDRRAHRYAGLSDRP